MEKVQRNAGTGPRQTIFVKATPEELRQIASELEELGKRCMPLEYIHYPISSNITVLYKPEVSRTNFVQISEFADVKQEIANRAAQDTVEAFSMRSLHSDSNKKDPETIGNA